MQIYNKTTPTIEECVAVLGFFDGVHIGHRELIKKALAERERLAVPVAVYTFFEHPRSILFPDFSARCIYTNAEKTEVLEALGVDVVIYEDFSAVRNLTPSQFVEEILIENLKVKSVVCGYNFRFGKDNSGDIDTLKSLLASYGIALHVIAPVCAGDEPVSSGRIRALIEKGEVDTARLLLGKPFSFSGKVCHGHRIGHSLGFPTANIKILSDKPTPPNGVYFTKTFYNGEKYVSVTNIGTRPTVGDGQTESVCETYIVDFDEDIYGEEIAVEFYKLHRPETRFDSLDTLSKNLMHDVQSAVDYFKSEEF